MLSIYNTYTVRISDVRDWLSRSCGVVTWNVTLSARAVILKQNCPLISLKAPIENRSREFPIQSHCVLFPRLKSSRANCWRYDFSTTGENLRAHNDLSHYRWRLGSLVLQWKVFYITPRRVLFSEIRETVCSVEPPISKDVEEFKTIRSRRCIWEFLTWQSLLQTYCVRDGFRLTLVVYRSNIVRFTIHIVGSKFYSVRLCPMMTMDQTFWPRSTKNILHLWRSTSVKVYM